MTPAELIARARDMVGAASPRPWRLCCASGGGCGSVFVWADDDEETPVVKADTFRARHRMNMELVAEAPDLISALAAALETSEKALAEAKAGESYALDQLAKLRHELVCFQRDTRTAIETVRAWQECGSAKLTCGHADALIKLQLPKGTR